MGPPYAAHAHLVENVGQVAELVMRNLVVIVVLNREIRCRRHNSLAKRNRERVVGEGIREVILRQIEVGNATRQCSRGHCSQQTQHGTKRQQPHCCSTSYEQEETECGKRKQLPLMMRSQGVLFTTPVMYTPVM